MGWLHETKTINSAIPWQQRHWTLSCVVLSLCVAGYSEPQMTNVTIEGRFGRAEVDVTAPSLTRLYLRGPDGLSKQSILAEISTPRARLWASAGYTYVIGQDERRYESRLLKPDAVDVSGTDGRTVVKIAGVKLATATGEEPVATEDWTISAPGDGTQLVWKIVRRWQKDFTATLSGSPALFFVFGAAGAQGAVTNPTTSTIWYDPIRMDAASSALYASVCNPAMISENHLQTTKDRDTWAIYKLWTPWHAPADLRLEVKGGHLYRRGVTYGLANEVGAVTTRNRIVTYRKGQVEEITVGISAVHKQTTGYQLAITLPDKTTESSLKDFYGSLLNGGAVNDQKGFDFGNQSEGYYYAGSSWMYGMALAAGVPAKGTLSSHSYDASSAFREHLAHILSLLDEQGRARFGFNESGAFVDDNLHTILGIRAYLLHSGDLAFVRQNLPALERMLGYFIQRRNDRGLFALAGSGGHWYYDAMPTSGVNSYYNAFFYKAACDLAEMESACGRQQQAGEYTALAQQIKTAFNEILWKENAPGGARYLDWIDHGGTEVAYFCDLCQWPAVAVGIAPPERARKIVATADARLAQLETEYGYQGFAGLSALWPVPASINGIGWQTFGNYMNGGMLLSQTYWEIVARARAGDAEGAARRLKRFAARAAETGWVGNNAANIKGDMGPGSGEPYLADMVVATAGVVHGVLGITPTWERLEVTPHLPEGWTMAEADVLYKGRHHHVSIQNDRVKIQPLEQVIRQPLQWLMDFNLRTAPGGVATVNDVDFHGTWSGSISLRPVDRGYLGFWKLDETAGAVLDSSFHDNQGVIEGQGVRRGEAGHVPSGHGYGFDGRGWVNFPHCDINSSMDRSESFTIQCWFKTETADDRAMLGKYGGFHVGVRDGKLVASLTDLEHTQEAAGNNPVADGRWHHVAAVVNRQTQQLALYLDGKLDTPNGAAEARNPADISAVGSISRRALSVGSVAGGTPFIGSLDDVSISRGALKPSEFNFPSDNPLPDFASTMIYTASGSYLSPPCNWGTRAKLADVTVAADLNGGQITATVEVSDDNFRTRASVLKISLRDGVNTYSLSSLRNPARAVRVRFDLMRGRDPTQSPTVDGFRLIAAPSTSERESPSRSF